MVFQDYALYPHMSVRNNIGFGLRARKFSPADIERQVKDAAEMLSITPLLDRLPRQLSGGQRQRVAIGRAIVRNPKLFLFDEPLSNLDAQLRDEMRVEIKRLHQEIATTIIYVTHDQIEAMTLADQIVLLRDGNIEQQGSPLDLFERPASRFVAGFLGSPQMNFLATRIEDIDGTPMLVFDEDRRLPLDPARAADYAEWRGRDVILGMRPEHMSRAADGAPRKPAEAPIRVLVDLVQPTGTRTYAQFRLNGTETTVELPSHTVERPGTTIDLMVDMSRVILIDPQSEKTIAG
jgi:multiple sugar transport system ATP-binding protein